MSLEFRTKDKAIQSAPQSKAILRSSSSCSVSVGTSNITPGKLTPLPNSTFPPTIVLQRNECFEINSVTSNCILPSLIKIFAPFIILVNRIP